tara:strand:- start:1999 stop:3345 length:1347 start_codon:yes stop_codon:yes gene_type:complete
MLAIAILAAGKGTRMVSNLPKVLHRVSGETLLNRIINTSKKLNPDKIFVVIGHKSDLVKESLSKDNNVEIVLQEPQLGTGHAVQVLSKELNDFKGNLLILNGDVPLIRAKSLKELLKLHSSRDADVSIITTEKENPFGYGRVFKKDNFIEKIIEEKDCSLHEKQNKLINAGIYCFNWEKLSKIINELKTDNKQKEFYITDTISLLDKAISYEILDEEEIQGVNNRVNLAKCEKILQRRIKTKHMLNGVTFINPESSSVSEESEIGIDVIIEANSHIRGVSKISDNCVIGPNTFLENTSIKKNSNIVNTTIFNSKIMENVNIGPYSHIRPGTNIASNSKVGNFVEIKNSHISQSVKINHLSYVGDSNIGKFTNVGAGTITANYDGIKKNITNIGEYCSIGSNSVLIAPITLGDSVTIGAGSVINKTVKSNSLAISRVKQLNIDNWKKSN